MLCDRTEFRLAIGISFSSSDSAIEHLIRLGYVVTSGIYSEKGVGTLLKPEDIQTLDLSPQEKEWLMSPYYRRALIVR
ncbi:unnamed protein product [Caretta caretta]